MSMPSTRTRLALAAAVVAVSASLAACGGGGGGGGGGDVVVPPAPPPTTTPIDQFGAQFALVFRTVANGEPIDPTPAVVPALSLTADPIQPN